MTAPQRSYSAVPSLRDVVPTVVLSTTAFLLGLAGITVGTNGTLVPPLSHILLIAGMAACVIFGGLILTSYHRWRLAHALDLRGIVLRGTITALWEDPSTPGKWRRSQPACYAAYTFNLDVPGVNSPHVHSHQRINPTLYHALHVGAPVRIRVLPHNPTISRMETRPWKWEYSTPDAPA
ncbi:hypothetical protein GF339_04355 [candidate division KSB3 bacterium]|jgi:hypothetical protein|uniref:DUF3592 domain-containing protein n=1 Tax=candidate division KSB3 bacterium TaxID=2044937 RepID=A0A9D5JT72_9BACT|nr:hypothetical protein [candidate division KSB3 bacterium]MBD3323792.1 hypothetical protein [candidate division KSB3 bacterium]